jgi:hypothetical protein
VKPRPSTYRGLLIGTLAMGLMGTIVAWVIVKRICVPPAWIEIPPYLLNPKGDYWKRPGLGINRWFYNNFWRVFDTDDEISRYVQTQWKYRFEYSFMWIPFIFLGIDMERFEMQQRFNPDVHSEFREGVAIVLIFYFVLHAIYIPINATRFEIDHIWYGSKTYYYRTNAFLLATYVLVISVYLYTFTFPYAQTTIIFVGVLVFYVFLNLLCRCSCECFIGIRLGPFNKKKHLDRMERRRQKRLEREAKKKIQQPSPAPAATAARKYKYKRISVYK